MEIAVLSDIHGNLQALESVLEELDGHVDGYISLGDVVGYGPDGDKCLEIMHSRGDVTVLRGNHEEIFTTGDTANCSPLARDFYAASVRHFTRFDLLGGRDEIRLGDWTFCHTIRDSGNWLYIYDANAIDFPLRTNYVIGHTHYQGVISKQGRQLVNPGSVGQNRAELGRACYAVFSTEDESFELSNVEYDLAEFVTRMKSCGYPERLICYYKRGKAPGSPVRGMSCEGLG